MPTICGMTERFFHFLTTPEHRLGYVRQVTRAVKPGGHAIIGTFRPEGPMKCSGLEVMRYDVESLHGKFGGTLPLTGELEGIAPNTIWNITTIPILLLPNRLASGRSAVMPRPTRITPWKGLTPLRRPRCLGESQSPRCDPHRAGRTVSPPADAVAPPSQAASRTVASSEAAQATVTHHGWITKEPATNHANQSFLARICFLNLCKSE